MNLLPSKCPVCNGRIHVVEIQCDNCGTTIRGAFARRLFENLDAGQVEFLRLFIESRGNLRQVGKHLGISYPSVRARLDEICEALQDYTASEAVSGE